MSEASFSCNVCIEYRAEHVGTGNICRPVEPHQEMYLSCCKYSDRQSHAYTYNSRRKKERERMALIFSRGLYCNKVQSCVNERNTATIGIP